MIAFILTMMLMTVKYYYTLIGRMRGVNLAKSRAINPPDHQWVVVAEKQAIAAADGESGHLMLQRGQQR